MVEPYRLHQNVEIPGVRLEYESDNRKESKFWNEGKWRNFIEPLLPEDDRGTFLEIGCNAGLYLRMAKEAGFRRAIGIETDPKACAIAEQYRQACGMDYTIINRAIDGDFDLDSLPACDVLLLANVHYYIDLNTWIALVDRMRHKARYCIVVSRTLRRQPHWMPYGDITHVRGYFQEWRRVRLIRRVPAGQDPAVRRLYSMLFASGLKSVEIEKVAPKVKGVLGRSVRSLAELIAAHQSYEDQKWRLYRLWKKIRQKGMAVDGVERMIESRIAVFEDVRDCGQKFPLFVNADGKLLDGGNRAVIMAALGYKHVIAREIN